MSLLDPLLPIGNGKKRTVTSIKGVSNIRNQTAFQHAWPGMSASNAHRS
jgi:hypothetical protein